MFASAVLAACIIGKTAADQFLSAKSGLVELHEVEKTFLAEDSDANRARISVLETELQSIFTALPKNENGNLVDSTVRYALHRHFEKKHGWHVKGLDARGQEWNSSSSSTVMKDRVPTHVFQLFSKRLNGHGFSLRDLAVFAATMSDLMHQDAVDLLADIFYAKRLSISGAVSHDDVDSALTYVVKVLTRGEDMTVRSPRDLRAIDRGIIDSVPHFPQTESWIQDTVKTFEWADGRINPFVREEYYSFKRASEMLRTVMDRFGKFDNSFCLSIKDSLARRDTGGIGRVRLSEYYSMTEEIEFHEDENFLRKTGILDETTRVPTVMIANYMKSSGNCGMVTNYFSVCCLDECEALMGHVEAAIAAPSAAPSKVAEVISNLPSESIEAPRNISTLLMSRLEEIAAIHGGQVLLHGRLFMQWMHHAYPRECAFPHVVGDATHMTEIEWSDWAGKQAIISESKRAQLSALIHDGDSFEAKLEHLPWNTMEELVAAKPQQSLNGGSKTLRLLVGALAIAAIVVPLTKAKSVMAEEKILSV